MSIREMFIVPKRYNTVAIALMVVGLISIIALYATQGAKSDAHSQARFWGSLLQNSVYFLLVVNAAMFFICATTLAWGGWQMAFRRVPEAISACVPVLSIVTFVVLMAIVFGGNHDSYHWTDAEHVMHDEILSHKKGFRNKTMFTVITVLTLVGWS